jgi:hypothetical protein
MAGDHVQIGILGALLLGACTDEGGAKAGDDDAPAAADSGEPEAAGDPRFQYLGASVVDEETTENGVTTRTFSTTEGRAACLRGAPFRASVRNTESADLVVFLQGGGACWDDFCLAVTAAPAGVPAVDILDPALGANPVADWNALYVPYCDGSLFIGDRDHDDDGDGTPERLHRGLANLSAALDLARDTVPAPERVLFAGSSGGGFGVLLASPIVREVFPEAELIVLADSAQGLAKGSEDPGFVAHLVDQWGAGELLPEGCESCLDDGHMTGVLDRTMRLDETLRVGLFSAWYDLVIGDIFLDLPPASFAAELESTSSALVAAHPDRFRRFFIDGRMHTTLLGDASGIVGDDLGAVEVPPEVLADLAGLELGSLETTASAEGLAVSEWIAGLIDNDDRWTDVVDAAGAVPE